MGGVENERSDFSYREKMEEKLEKSGNLEKQNGENEGLKTHFVL